MNTVRDAQIGNFYLCTVHIGSPKKEVRLVATFSHGQIVLSTQMRNLLYLSSTWLSKDEESGFGYDQVMISGDIYRWPIQHSPDVTICNGLCMGEIGFGPSSTIWSLWSNIQFFSSFIKLGGSTKRTGELASVSFTKSTESTIYLRSNSPSGVTSVRLDGEGKTVVPQELFDGIIYHGEELQFHTLNYVMNLNSALRRTDTGVSEMRITPSENRSETTVTFGSVLFKDYDIYVNRFDDTLTLYQSSGDSSGRTLLPWHTVVIFLLWMIILYWKMTDICLLFDYTPKLHFFVLWRNPDLDNDLRTYWFTKLGHGILLSIELILVPVAFFINGPSTYDDRVDLFLTASLSISWLLLVSLLLSTVVNGFCLKNYNPMLLEFSIWFRFTSEVCPLTVIIILLLNGTKIDVGMGIIISFFACVLIYTVFRTLVSFLVLLSLLPSVRVFFHIFFISVWTGISLWILWQYFFNSFLLFISEALSVNVNLITACAVLLIACIVSFFHKQFLVANICNRLNYFNKPKTQ